MNLKLLVLSIFLLISPLAFAQDGVNYEMKRQAFTMGLSMQGDFFMKGIPAGFYLDLGYDFRKLYEEEAFFMGIGPRVKGGWLSGDNDGLYSLDWLDLSFNTLVYGVSVAPSIGYEFIDDPHIGIFLEGEVGAINYNTTAKVSDKYIELIGGQKKYNSTMNLYTAVRLGLRFNIASKKEMSFWIGGSNQNTKNILDGLNLNEKRFENKKIYMEVGLNFGF